MRRSVALLLLLAAACSKPTPEDQAARDQRAVAMVQKANDTLPPLEEVVPEPVGYPEIAKFDISGASCNYAPGTSFGTLVIARRDDAFMKIAGKVQRFAADPGARGLPQGTRALYNSREFSLKLAIADHPRNEQKRDLEGSVTLFDPQGRVVFEGTGLARCSA